MEPKYLVLRRNVQVILITAMNMAFDTCTRILYDEPHTNKQLRKCSEF